MKIGGRYAMDDGQVVVDSIESIRRRDLTDDLAQESGFRNVRDLIDVAAHGGGRKTYLIRFHYVPPGGWNVRNDNGRSAASAQPVARSRVP